MKVEWWLRGKKNEENEMKWKEMKKMKLVPSCCLLSTRMLEYKLSKIINEVCFHSSTRIFPFFNKGKGKTPTDHLGI